ncbi:MAG: N-acetylmuramoyl-L-alanine amidase [Desulfobulbaceae bacterium]|nr:N-acetylmuramoyl-L-alanine amidase [Desulfobulbaceae bacterium]
MKQLSTPKGIIIHHSATRDTDSISYDAIRRFHVGEKGWDEIGYHYLIERVSGKSVLFTGRGLQYYGAHCKGKNDSIGICVVGNYDDTGTAIFTDGKIETLINTLTGLLFIYPKIKVSDIHFHREYADKTCPGTRFPKIETIRAFVMSRVIPANFVGAE